jgi:hypothetical protein
VREGDWSGVWREWRSGRPRSIFIGFEVVGFYNSSVLGWGKDRSSPLRESKEEGSRSA